MNKTTLSLIALGIAGAAVIAYVSLDQRGGKDLSAASLLPQQTIALLELPELPASGERWKKTSLYKIGQEPEVKAFMERPLAQLPKDAAFDEICQRVKEAGGQQAFVAVASIEKNSPKVVAGIRYEGSRNAVEDLVGRVRDRVKKSAPSGKSELEQYHGYEIESFSDQEVVIGGAFAKDWYFMANDVALLKATLDRFEGRLEDAALSANDDYTASVDALPNVAELRFYLNYGQVSQRLLDLIAIGGGNMDEASQEEMRKVKGIAFSTTFEADLIRETLYMHAPGIRQQPTLTGATDSLITASTTLYSAFVTDLSRVKAPDPATDPMGVFNSLRKLEAEGIGGKELNEAFGPEAALGLNLVMPAGFSLTIPPNLLAIQVKDRAAAERIMQVVAEGWARTEEDGTIYWSSAPVTASMLSLTGTVALSDQFLIGGLEATGSQGAAIRGALNNATSKTEPKLVDSETYRKALSTVQKPDVSVAYLDVKTVFERLYATLRPAAMFAGTSMPQLATWVDLLKLPATETISKHLHPSIVTSTQNADGFRVESAGTFTFTQGLVGFAVAAGGAAKALAPFMKDAGGSVGGFPLPGASGTPGGSGGKAPTFPGLPAPQTPEAEGPAESE